MPQQKESKIDVHALFHLIKRRKWFVIIPLILAAVGGYIRIITLVSEYRSSVTILLGKNTFLTQTMQKVVPGVQARDKMKLRDKRETLIKQFQSHALLTKVIDAIDLKPSARQLERARKLVEAQGDGLTIEEAVKSIQASSLKKKVEVTFPKRGEHIVVSSVSRKPENAYLIAKHVVDTFIEADILKDKLGNEGTKDFSSEQLKIYKEKLDKAEKDLRNFSMNAAASSNIDIPVTVENLSHVQELKSVSEKEISNNLREISRIDRELGRDSALMRVRITDRAANTKAKLIEKNAELSTLLITNAWNSGPVVSLNSKIAPLKEELTGEIRNYGGDQMEGVFPADKIQLALDREILKAEIAFSNVQKKTIDRLLNLFQSAKRRLPRNELKIQKLQGEVEKSRQVYQTFLEQVRSSQIRAAMSSLDKEIRYKIIDPAQLPTEPINAGTNQVILVALVLGIGLGSGFIYLLEFIDQSFKSAEDIEDYLGLIVLGTIPKINFEERTLGRRKKKFSLFS